MRKLIVIALTLIGTAVTAEDAKAQLIIGAGYNYSTPYYPQYYGYSDYYSPGYVTPASYYSVPSFTLGYSSGYYGGQPYYGNSYYGNSYYGNSYYGGYRGYNRGYGYRGRGFR